MRWNQQERTFKAYLAIIFGLSLPAAVYSLTRESSFGIEWACLAIVSVFAATINVRLPKISSVISMGDVFVILSLFYFGPGPTLVMYWLDIAVATFSDTVRQYGTNVRGKIVYHRFLFNLSCCALSVYAMHASSEAPKYFLQPNQPLYLILSLSGIALSWFLVNTVTLSLAISFWMQKGFWSVWREGQSLYLMNFLGSAAAAGLIKLFYDGVGSYVGSSVVFFLCVPIVVVLFQLYRYHISKYEQAQKHISDLNKLYLQTVETLAAAVDAKDRYTHGHIRRVQAFAIELAQCMGITQESELMALRAGALLHDIGKIAIPEYILNKPTALTDSEYTKMKLHPVVGGNMLKNIEFPYPVLPMVRFHHERWDGNGYPDGLKGEDIPIGARILALVDCYDALTTDRPYRAPMERGELVEFFRKESGKAYDPAVVDALLNNIDRLEEVGKTATAGALDIWGIRELNAQDAKTLRPLQKVQPIVTYGKALTGDAALQANLFSAFEFARANIQCLNTNDVFAFMGRKLEELVEYDAAVFFLADLENGNIVAEHVQGIESAGLKKLTLPLEKKLSGWVASNNQSLCNLPPFPDFMGCGENPPAFEMSAIVPMNSNGIVWGAISLYRKQKAKFSEDEFRRLEIVASQTALALSNCHREQGSSPLIDTSTGLPNGYHLHLMFDQLAADANKFDYPFAVLVFRLDDRRLRRRWGYVFGEEGIRVTASFLKREFRDNDLVIRYAADEFFAIVPRVDRVHAEGLKARLQEGLNTLQVPIRAGTHIGLPVTVGLAMFPEDGQDLEALVRIANWQARENRLHTAQPG
jgi:diguanylate cyclase (GGDEF)-like protein/putative nucleotidyltransferase with HDIG domain